MNVTEHENYFDIEFAAPGFTKKDFDITIEDDVLHVSGEKKKQTKEKEKDFTVKEFSYKSFRRSTRIPESVDLDQKIKASYKNGILTIKLLKLERDFMESDSPKKVIEVE